MMRNPRFYNTLPVVLPLLLCGCSGELSVLEETVRSEKIIGTEASADRSKILVCTDASGASLEGLACERLFPSTPGKEAIEHKYGLDRWFIVEIPESGSLSQVSSKLAGDDAVKSIEYCSELTRPFWKDEDIVLPAETRAHYSQTPVGMNDPLFKSQWFLYNNGDSMFGSGCVAGTDVNVRDAWKLCAGIPEIVVAVVDEGVKYTHPDLAANMWVNTKEIEGNGIDDDHNGYVDDVHGYNFAEDSGVSWGKPGDEGHGTHVAGLVAAVNNNGIGISSVAGGSGKGDGVRLMSCQIFSGTKRNDNAAVAKAIKYAADNGASVLQCSFGLGSYYSDKAFSEGLSSVKAALDYFRAPENANNKAVDGNIVIISAGNTHSAKAEYPGAYRDYICVSAVSQDNLPAWYTNYGQGVNIAAPGGDNTFAITMLSTLPSENGGNDYGFMHGTSMATPVVSGIAALGLSYAVQLGRHFTRDEFEAMILSSVNAFDNSRMTGTKKGVSGSFSLDEMRGRMGTGVIDAWKMLMNVEGTPFVTVKAGEASGIDLKEFFGDDAANLTFTGISISQSDRNAIGLTSDPTVSSGVMNITCSKAGCAKVTINAIAGGTTAGTESEIGGKVFSKTVSVVARENISRNGGWL